MKKILMLMSVLYATTNNAMQGMRSMVQRSITLQSIRQNIPHTKSSLPENNNLQEVQRRIAELEMAEIQRIADPIKQEYALLKRQEDILRVKESERDFGHMVFLALGINAGVWAGFSWFYGIFQ